MLKLHLPRLADKIVTKTVVRLLIDQPKASLLVDAARGHEDALRPQRHRRVADFACGADAFVHQRLADAKPARLRLDQQQAQFADALAGIDERDAANRLAADLRDPAAFALGIEILDE